MSPPRVSVIVPAWNGRDFLADCLDSVLAQPGAPHEVIVVDNASTDGSAELVAARFPAVRLVRHVTNLGFAGGCNAGLRVAQGEVCVLLNQDARVEAGWLPPLLDRLQQPAVGIVGCKIVYPDGETIQHAGGRIEWPLALAHHDGQGEPDDGRWDEPRAVPYVTGAAMAFPRSLLDEIGWLDEGFWPGYFEDADFCFRVRAAGYEVWVEPRARVTHVESTSLTDPTHRSAAYQRGRLRFLLKHLPLDRLLHEWPAAETAYQRPAIFGQESSALRHAYLEALASAATLLRARGADAGLIGEVSAALERLHGLAWQHNWARGLDDFPHTADADTVPLADAAPPPLRPYAFHSDAPIVGPLMVRLRSAWYNVAARWADQALGVQQDAINLEQVRVQGWYVRALEQRVRLLAAENAWLARELGELRRDLDAHRAHDTTGDP